MRLFGCVTADQVATESGEAELMCTDESIISRRLTAVRALTAAYETELRSTLAELQRRIEEEEVKAAEATECDEDRESDDGQGTLGAWWDPRSYNAAPLAKSSPLPPLFETAGQVIRSMPRKKGVDGNNDEAPPVRPPSPEPFSGTVEAVTALECRAAGMLARELDSRHGGALGLLVGRRGRWVLRSSTVILGRRDSITPSSSSSIKDSDAGNASPAMPNKLPLDVDISLELGQEGARRLSRRQAVLWVDMDEEEGSNKTATFCIRCLGRRAMTVSGRTLVPGASVRLAHGSLIQVGGASLMLLPNPAALARLRARADAASA